MTVRNIKTARVFPALAGVNRGDNRVVSYGDVFPALAGVNRVSAILNSEHYGLPRARGG